MEPLRKTTHTYAHHSIQLDCDVFDAADYPIDAPVFLFFHAGGLVGGNRTCVPPWLVQTCYRQKWPLISASYRLVPPIGGKELLEDVTAAYQFARKLGNGVERKVIVGGASAGFFMAGLVAHHLQPPPLALLSITGIATFHHPFFHSSIQLTPSPIPKSEVEHFFEGPVVVGCAPEYGNWAFSTSMLLPASTARNPDYVHPKPPAEKSAHEKDVDKRDTLYDYFVYENAFGGIVGEVDPGFDWALEKSEKWNAWPPTIFIQGDADVDVDKDVSVSAANKLGEKSTLFMAERQPHLFEASSFLEDESVAMDTVHAAIAELKRAVNHALVQN
ncbi:uncharacterized protein N7482_007603 [Penicillium canariense]|uniref:Alpha/beta hydrolase fold-3 domain-containing protein n=1 Tax=Penicillium canariense TaxID=189055 RepID=A0A9W9HYF5_9EURO|nr:uncharacterized protein N7482_007603 [Penicillium canariense]KAJ5160599.1 hypothetical protein N7482_007603 [Penicillium canariense]